MKKNNLVNVLKKIYKLLDNKQKFRFLIIIVIMIVSAVLAQMTPKAIGWLTDDILSKSFISFDKVIFEPLDNLFNLKSITHLKVTELYNLHTANEFAG